MTGFTSLLRVEHIDGKYWRVLEPFEYHVGAEDSDEIIVVPAGFVTDFASIPRWAWWLIGSPTGKYGKAAVVHDFLYSENADEQGEEYKKRKRRMCDSIFLEGMIVLGIAWWRRTAMYSAVRVGGGMGWGENRKENAK